MVGQADDGAAPAGGFPFAVPMDLVDFLRENPAANTGARNEALFDMSLDDVRTALVLCSKVGVAVFFRVVGDHMIIRARVAVGARSLRLRRLAQFHVLRLVDAGGQVPRQVITVSRVEKHWPIY